MCVPHEQTVDWFYEVYYTFVCWEHTQTHRHTRVHTPKSYTMADLEAVLADVSYLMAMEKSKCTPAARASKKIILPDPRWVIRLFIILHQIFFITHIYCHHFGKWILDHVHIMSASISASNVDSIQRRAALYF